MALFGSIGVPARLLARLRPGDGAPGPMAAAAPALTMIFQPALDISQGKVFGYEALVRGPGGESAKAVLAGAPDDGWYALEQHCRRLAIETASRAGLFAGDDAPHLSINIQPSAVLRAEVCMHSILRAAKQAGLATRRLVLEVSERNPRAAKVSQGEVFEAYRRMGFATAIDDAGLVRSSLESILRFGPDVVKLDQRLVRGIETDPERRRIVASFVRGCERVDARLVAKGVETDIEADVLCGLGIKSFQGFLFGPPSGRPAN